MRCPYGVATGAWCVYPMTVSVINCRRRICVLLSVELECLHTPDTVRPQHRQVPPLIRASTSVLLGHVRSHGTLLSHNGNFGFNLRHGELR